MTTNRHDGTVVKWLVDRGFGFAGYSGGTMFLHLNEVEPINGSRPDSLAIGERVSFEITEVNGRPRGVRVKLLDA